MIVFSLPGKSDLNFGAMLDPANLFGMNPKAKDAPPPPPPPPTRDDPAVVAAQEKQRLAEKQRKGRAATVLTGATDPLGDLSLARPEARGATLLGQ